jgi:hypothetical protein
MHTKLFKKQHGGMMCTDLVQERRKMLGSCAHKTFHKMWRISGLANELLASQNVNCSKELVTTKKAIEQIRSLDTLKKSSLLACQESNNYSVLQPLH